MKFAVGVVSLALVLSACGDDQSDSDPKDRPTLTDLVVTPGTASAATDSAVQFTATGTFSDGTTADLTATVIWSAAPSAVATMNPTGLATTKTPGLATVNALFGSRSATARLQVTTVTLSSIAVTPETTSVGIGATVPLVATGTYSDETTAVLTSAVTWTSSDTQRATVANTSTRKGVVTGVAQGSVVITAALNNVSGTANVSVDIPPAVGSTIPANEEAAANVRLPISITFNRAMLPSTLTTQSEAGACSGSIQVSRDNFATCVALNAPVFTNANQTALVTAAPALAYGATYKIRVTTGARSSENVLLPAEFTQAVGFTMAAPPACAVDNVGGVVISGVYAFGAETGAAYRSDYIELYNPTNAPVALSGALQYAAANSSAWDQFNLSTTIEPHAYYLFGAWSPDRGPGDPPPPGEPLPATDGSRPSLSSFALAQAGGKIAITRTQTPITTNTPSNGSALDFVGWGTATAYERTAAPAASVATQAIARRASGCEDTNDNAADFEIATANARNSSITHNCECTANESAATPSAEVEFCQLQNPTTIEVASGVPTQEIFSRLSQVGVTSSDETNADVRAQIGFGPVGNNPESQGGWSWTDATFVERTGSDHRYSASVAVPAAGVYAFGARFSLDGVHWTYCDRDGAGAAPTMSFDPAKLGRMTVTSP